MKMAAGREANPFAPFEKMAAEMDCGQFDCFHKRQRQKFASVFRTGDGDRLQPV